MSKMSKMEPLSMHSHDTSLQSNMHSAGGKVKSYSIRLRNQNSKIESSYRAAFISILASRDTGTTQSVDYYCDLCFRHCLSLTMYIFRISFPKVRNTTLTSASLLRNCWCLSVSVNMLNDTFDISQDVRTCIWGICCRTGFLLNNCHKQL